MAGAKPSPCSNWMRCCKPCWSTLMRATSSALADKSLAVMCKSGQAMAASTAKLPLPVHKSRARVACGSSQASAVPLAMISAIRLRGMMLRASTKKGTPCSHAWPVK